MNLFSKVASSIVTILTSIANSPAAAYPLPRVPGQRKDLSWWYAPALFGDAPIKSDYLPLGYQFQPYPDQGRRCDSSSCSISVDTPWKIFEGCWHSFHLCCLTVVDVCPICRKGIETAIKSLANIANQSLRQQQNGTATDGSSEAGEVSREVSDGDDDDDDALISTVDGNVEQVVQNLTLQIMALTVASSPAQPLSPARVNVVSTPCPSTQRRPPHCSTCVHLKQGHQRPVALSEHPVSVQFALLSHA